MRAARQWAYLDLLQQSGAVYDYQDVNGIPLGGLVHFCPTCPQGDVNLPDNWREDPDQ